ncbi:MAG: hypothetical protein QXU18_06260 [Thermoplasmatales archaeon]
MSLARNSSQPFGLLGTNALGQQWTYYSLPVVAHPNAFGTSYIRYNVIRHVA